VSSVRPLRAAFGLLLVLALVAGGQPFGHAHPAAAVAGSVGEVEPGARTRGDDRCPVAGEGSVTAAIAAAPRMRPLARWRDLRSGGLPAPRAPDAAPVPMRAA
jgi:hypothetical protein